MEAACFSKTLEQIYPTLYNSKDYDLICKFKQLANARKKSPKIHFIYLNNKEIYSSFKTCCMMSVLFSTQRCFFRNSIILCSNNTHAFH